VLPFTNLRFTTPFMFTGGKTPDINARGYTQIMKEQMLKGEENEVSIKLHLNKNLFIYPNQKFVLNFSATESFVSAKLILLTTYV
jgi:hypothetical protein